MAFLLDLLIAFLIVVGSVFLLVGSAGLIKLRDLMTRLHAPTKATTLGIGSVLLASMVHFIVVRGAVSVHEILIMVFLFLTAPVTAHFVAKAHLHENMRDGAELPPTERDCGWSTFDPGSRSPGESGQPPSRGRDNAED
jgi:multicomponent K+:H+ antiporter subunit G